MSATVDDILTDMQKFYSKSLNIAQMKLYREELGKLDEDLLCKAAIACKAKEPLNFFPTPFVIKRYYNEAVESAHNETKRTSPIFADIQRNAKGTDHGRESIALMIQFQSGKLNRAQYLVRMMDMHEKYPNAGWEKNARELQMFWDAEPGRHVVGKEYLERIGAVNEEN